TLSRTSEGEQVKARRVSQAPRGPPGRRSIEDVRQRDGLDGRRGDRTVAQKPRLAGDQQWSARAIIDDAAMGAAYQGGIERDDVHQGAQAERALCETPRNGKFRKTNGRVEKELDWIVARLAMDLDEPGKIRSTAVVEPVIIGEPGVGTCQRDELARMRV